MNGKPVRILGGGPAGAAAGIAACGEGADVVIFEKSRTPRHKVCGEFISPEACQRLRELGVWERFLLLHPSQIRYCVLRFGSRVKRWSLPDGGFGLSRLELDRLLLDHAEAMGATVCRGEYGHAEDPTKRAALVIASGRPGIAPKPGRLFGFKSHFEGPANDAVEVFFSETGYTGVSAVENGLTNVCGIASEDALRRYDFQFDDFVRASPALAERLRPLSRCMP